MGSIKGKKSKEGKDTRDEGGKSGEWGVVESKRRSVSSWRVAQAG